MQASAYTDVHRDAPEFSRDLERRAFDTGIRLLEDARELPNGTPRAIDALRHIQELWGILIKDLGDPANELPAELRANLISIGLWVMREADNILAGKSENWDGLIEINRTVREGLAT